MEVVVDDFVLYVFRSKDHRAAIAGIITLERIEVTR